MAKWKTNKAYTMKEGTKDAGTKAEPAFVPASPAPYSPRALAALERAGKCPGGRVGCDAATADELIARGAAVRNQFGDVYLATPE